MNELDPVVEILHLLNELFVLSLGGLFLVYHVDLFVVLASLRFLSLRALFHISLRPFFTGASRAVRRVVMAFLEEMVVDLNEEIVEAGISEERLCILLCVAVADESEYVPLALLLFRTSLVRTRSIVGNVHYALIFFFGKNTLGNCVYVRGSALAFGLKESLSDLAEDAAPVYDLPILVFRGEEIMAFWFPTFLPLLIFRQNRLQLLNRLVQSSDLPNIFNLLCREEVVRSGLLFL